jgi:hypothetical protein
VDVKNITGSVLVFSCLLVAVTGFTGGQGLSAAEPLFAQGKVYIQDRTGEKWDVTQAKSLGFKAEGFQYGLGRNAFVTLDDSMLTDNTSGMKQGTRVIGISENDDVKAYSVVKLRKHEVANSTLNGRPVAVAY